MKILNLELGFSDFYEDYSYENPKSYGGGPIFGRAAREIWNNTNSGIEFWQVGCKENFRNLTSNERTDRCIILDDNQLKFIRNGGPINNIIKVDDFDIIIYHHTCFKLNLDRVLKCKEVFWSGFGIISASANQPNILLYDPYEYENYKTHDNIYKIVIGKPVEPFRQREKEDFIFCCQRNDEFQNTAEIAVNCLKYGIKGIFAGRIWPGYNLLDYIDGKTTYYLGDNISETEKMEYTSKSLMTCFFHKTPTYFNLSAIESLSVNTPILANPTRCFNYIVKENENGWIFNGNNFLDCYLKSKNINQKEVYNSSLPYSSQSMLNSFEEAFKKILNK